MNACQNDFFFVVWKKAGTCSYTFQYSGKILRTILIRGIKIIIPNKQYSFIKDSAF